MFTRYIYRRRLFLDDILDVAERQRDTKRYHRYAAKDNVLRVLLSLATHFNTTRVRLAITAAGTNCSLKLPKAEIASLSHETGRTDKKCD